MTPLPPLPLSCPAEAGHCQYCANFHQHQAGPAPPLPSPAAVASPFLCKFGPPAFYNSSTLRFVMAVSRHREVRVTGYTNIFCRVQIFLHNL